MLTYPAFFFSASATSFLNHHPKALIFNASTINFSPYATSFPSRPPAGVHRGLIVPLVRALGSTTSVDHPSAAVSSSSSGAVAVLSEEQEKEAAAAAKIGSRVRVKVPLKVYHVPRVPEIDLTGKEGMLKQYVGVWKGKRISANLPFKVEFVEEVEGRGLVKFFAHLKEDEFEYLD